MPPRITRGACPDFEITTDVAIVGAGACGLVAALKARSEGADVVVLERDPTPSGSTAMSSGFIPAPGTRFQRSIGVDDDDPVRFADDIQRKSGNQSQAALTKLVAKTIGPALEWLADAHGLEWIVLDDFLYPGHTRHRMHAVPEKTGEALMTRLLQSASAAGVTIVCDAQATTLHLDQNDCVSGLTFSRPGGQLEQLGCKALILACNGYGGNASMVGQHIPEIANGLYYGHAGNQGDAVLWGKEMGAATAHLSGYQGHGSVAHPHNILITWAIMMEGGIQVNLNGQRFSNEDGGYSEQAASVLAQPQGLAWNIYDARIHDFALGFPDYVGASQSGAIICADSLKDLAVKSGLPADALQNELAELRELSRTDRADPFGRRFSDKPPLEPPYYAVKVTGALFHTQGGLLVDDQARVLRLDGSTCTNLFAGGGAACGVSGPDKSGYLSGNGLLTAVALGFRAGACAAMAPQSMSK
ncbi:MAG: FAD-dependent oxidoreductase [Pseudomonadota bacterium]